MMVAIFYDFETSSLSALGQILSYSLVVVDAKGSTLDECNGWVQLNRCELPDLDALLVTGIRLHDLGQQGRPEPEVAHRLHHFLASWIQKEGSVTLCGYNSNRFDLRFLRSLFIRHGLNPYFFGKLKHKDVLHYVKQLAVTHPDFHWQEQDGRWTFTLERMGRAYGILHTTQSHDARADVLLTIALCQALSSAYPLSFTAFQPISLPVATTPLWQAHHISTPPQRHDWLYMVPVTWQKNTSVWVSVADLSPPFPQDATDWAPFLNALQHATDWCHAYPASPDAMASLATPLHHIQSSPFLNQLSVDAYFSSRTQDAASPRDVEHRLTRLPFDDIRHLSQAIRHLSTHWHDAPATLSRLNESHQDVARLAMRYAFNHAPDPLDPRLADRLKAYLAYRHLSGLADPHRTIDALHTQCDRAKMLLSDPHTPTHQQGVVRDYLDRVHHLFPDGLVYAT